MKTEKELKQLLSAEVKELQDNSKQLKKVQIKRIETRIQFYR